ncbi:amylo-alpha-1,6-glucosidase [Magnetospirillum aberrantis]|uniref:Glycogen debranching protein n=1 Tax=Magnetospirillum aberrantis SpK TaxID=908842 RepID=A0A7C9UXT2_9PROT|nr:amylo-alpha-1,6-glucosidase [Magnetospirillum aberrantis]NFV81112.1 glycogen debranching protein [Magnetospirillum aberrantis SpK]
MSLLQLHVGATASWAGKEWMTTNGLGGYASGTLAGDVSRRHDGLLVAALDAPRGRTVMLDQLEEVLLLPGGALPLFELAVEFRLDGGLPVWRFVGAGRVIERRVVMPWRQNTVHVQYHLLEGAAVELRLRPWLHVRHADWGLDQDLIKAHPVVVEDGCVEIACAPWPALRLAVAGWRADWDDPCRRDMHYAIESGRGYLDHGPQWSPGTLTATLDGALALAASTESWAIATALDADDAWAAERERRRRLLSRAHPALRADEMAALLTLAADAFVFTPRNRPQLLARVQAEGDGVCSSIAGYPWFNDWGRDTMIGLEGLMLITGRHAEARDTLRTFARYLKDGLIPDNIPDGPWPPVYHTADATLWFFHAVDRYVAHTGDMETLELILPKLEEVVERHMTGTLYGIGVDPEDGLLRAAADGYQLTWMDAIVGDWVVTPRRGKPVEINALWYNALCVMARWLAETGKTAEADRVAAAAERARESFNARFWYAEGGYLYDVVDGDPGEAPLLRPNQLLSLSLPNPVLDPRHWRRVVEVVRDRLLTPFGLRSLPSDHPAYRGRFDGDQLARDGAYHQGTVWPFLLGPFVDAWLRVWPQDHAGARAVLAAMAPHLGEYCVGTIAEVFDGDPPHTPRGCTAQGWSVAEWLRAWVAAS